MLLLAGAIKAADPSLFVEQITSYGITPAAWSPPLSRLFLMIEFGLGTALVVNLRPRLTLPASVALFAVFTGVLLWAKIEGYAGDCGCFGRVSARGVGSGIVEDLVFAALGLLAWFTLRRRPGGRHPWQLATVVAGVTLGLVSPILAQALDVGHLVTAARPGAPFDQIVVEDFDGDIQRGEYVVALLDPEGQASVEAVESLNGLADDESLPPLVGVFQGSSEAMVAFLFEHGTTFDGYGHAPRAALRRFYRRLPVVLALSNGKILSAWHERIPAVDEVRGRF